MTRPVSFPLAFALALPASLLMAACGRAPEAAAGGGAAAAASAPPVGVTTVAARQQDVPMTLSATGTVTPLSSVDVRPQLAGTIAQVHVREGQFVKAGELLFTMDSRADEAKVAQAQAQVARDEASLADARRQLQRSRELLAQGFVSQGAVDATQALVDSQQALVAADRAAVAAAKVSLSYARITAPGAGRVGTVAVFPGSSVKSGDTTLVTITQLDPIAVAVGLPQRHLADALAALPGGGAPVSAVLPDGGGTLNGRLKFVDNLVDPASGTVKVKAVFANQGGKLWPGAFVTVSMTARTLKDAVVVPQASIIQSSRGNIVYVAQAGQATARPVQVVYAEGDDAAVTGVKPGERVVLDGRQNLRNGAAVVERAPAAAPGASSPTATASAATNGASAP